MRTPDLSRYLEMSEDALLMEIARAASPEPLFYSPRTMVARGRKILEELLDAVRARVCPHVGVAKGPEVELVASIAGLLTGGVPVGLIPPVAAYVVKRGLTSLCEGWEPED